MRVTICGPNLRDQSRGQFHVHAKGCGDLKKLRRKEPEYENGWTIEADSRQTIVEEIYSDQMAEWERDHPGDDVDWHEYDDIHLFPCVELPDMRASEDDTEELDSDALEKSASAHGKEDGRKTAADVFSADVLVGYLEENLDEGYFETAPTDELDKIARAYALAFITQFSEACREVLNEFLQDKPYDE